jgi:hypothetical protein
MSVLFRAGLQPLEPAVAYLWPCNVQTWGVWTQVQTEWRSNGQGHTWLDYTGVRAYLDELGYSGAERKDIFTGIRAADAATREVWAQQAKERAAKQ